MKKIQMILAAAVMAIGLAGCWNPFSKAPAQPAFVDADKIASVVSNAICQKYSTCNPTPEFSKEQCTKDASAGISASLKKVTDLKINETQLETCKTAIDQINCEGLSNPNPPAGCEFLQ